MAITLSAPPDVTELTMDATAGNVEAVTLHKNTRSLIVYFRGSDGEYTWSGTDGAAIGADAMTVPAETPYRIEVAGRGRDLAGRIVYLAGTIASQVVLCESSAREVA